VVCGALLASPVLLLQVWRFVAPGLYRHEKKAMLIFAVISTLCFLGGGLFGYLVVFPPAFRFLAGYSNDYLYALPTVSEYFSLSLRLLVAFGVIFELPVLMVFLAKLGIVNGRFFSRHRRYAILIAFIIAAILTPTPDVVNQLLMAAPLIVLYELGIIAVRILAGSSAEAEEPTVSR